MKKSNGLFVTGLIIIGSLVTSCNGSGDQTGESSSIAAEKGQLFGKLAGMVEDYATKIDKKEKQIKENTDLDKAFKLSKELELLKEEKDKSISGYLDGLDTPLSAPLVQEGNEEFYRVRDLVVAGWQGSLNFARISCTSTVEVLKEFPKGMIYIQLYTGDNPTGQWLLLNPPPNATNQLMAGQTYEFKGPMIPKYLIGVTKLVAKTKEDYAAAKK